MRGIERLKELFSFCFLFFCSIEYQRVVAKMQRLADGATTTCVALRLNRRLRSQAIDDLNAATCAS